MTEILNHLLFGPTSSVFLSNVLMHDLVGGPRRSVTGMVYYIDQNVLGRDTSDVDRHLEEPRITVFQYFSQHSPDCALPGRGQHHERTIKMFVSVCRRLKADKCTRTEAKSVFVAEGGKSEMARITLIAGQSDLYSTKAHSPRKSCCRLDFLECRYLIPLCKYFPLQTYPIL